MEEKTLEYYHLKIEQLLTSNESLNQEKSDLQNEVEALQERIDELEKEVSTYRDTLNFILEELYKIRDEAGIESYGIDVILNVLRGNNKALKTKEVKD